MYSAFCGFVAITSILLYFSNELPNLQNLKTEIRNPAVTIQTYDGKIIGSYGDLYEDVVNMEDLPKYAPLAFMAVEDKRFFQHFGVDFIGFFRAAYQNYVTRRIVQGGSTITQQLAKNILIAEGVVTYYDRSLSRKVKELLLAFWLEHKFSKREILMMYLNRVYFGAGTYGIDAASRKYFNKPAKKLTIFEAAVLAGLLKAPAKYNPTNHPNYAHERAITVLKAMEEQGFIKSAKDIENEQAKKVLSEETKQKQNYMYFCDYAYEQAKMILGDIEDDIVIVTTFDEKKQSRAEEAVDFYIKTEGTNYKFSQVSFICLSRDGAVQAMIGGNGYSATQFNRAVQAKRLAGSAFKLFIYGAALEHGYQLTDMISDKPVSIAGWKPKNYKWQTRGTLSVLDGFTYSVNAVSIRLAQAIGLSKIAKFAKKLGVYGVSTHDMSVALGTAPVTLKDLTAAYASFMDGMPIWPYCILEIRTKSGEILYQKSKEATVPVIDNETLTLGRKLLRSVISRGTGRAANVNEFMYGKTGTNGDSDAWFIGFYDPPSSPNSGFSLGVWIGNDLEKEKMVSNSTGGRIPARIAKMFIEQVLKPSGSFPIAKTDFLENEEKTSQTKSLGALLNETQ
ncbi:MAG: transglycosylase domain-containing protein [Holosporales bacterium]|jgi:penicillin-binding protein 1A|nr:transglycosylase domain-containing protein [Holosporales bacterium]